MDNHQLPDDVKNVPGVWGNMMSFYGGPHACIGFRFALLEWDLFFHALCVGTQIVGRTRILLHTLISAFRFKLAVPAEEVVADMGVITRPMWTKEPEKGSQLPLLISRVNTGAD
jgi:hypothetical protein